MGKRRRSSRAILAASCRWSDSVPPSSTSLRRPGAWRYAVTSFSCRPRARVTTCSRTMNSAAASSSVSSVAAATASGNQQVRNARRNDEWRRELVTAGSTARDAVFAATARVETRRDERTRWRMGKEAQALVLVSSVLLAYGLAVLYSASALVAMNENHGSAFYLVRQLTGAAAGVIAFALAAKLDAEKWHEWAWPLMLITIATMVLTLVLPDSIAPRINGSKRFLFGSSFQPSELGKLGVIVWVAMLVVRKGDSLRRLTKGLVPFLVVIGVLDVLAALEPDLSVSMLYTLLLALLLFIGGARMGHFIALAALAIPVLWHKIERLQYAVLCVSTFLDPGGAPAAVNYQ